VSKFPSGPLLKQGENVLDRSREVSHKHNGLGRSEVVAGGMKARKSGTVYLAQFTGSECGPYGGGTEKPVPEN